MRLEHFCEAHPLQVMPSLISKFWFFLTHCRVFASVGLRVLKCSKIGHARRMGNFTREITLNDKYLNQFLSDYKVLWMTLEQLVETFIKLPILDCSRAICVLLQGQNQLLVPIGWGKARKTSKISQDSFPRSHWFEQMRRQNNSESYIENMPKGIFSKNLFHVEIICRKMPFHR
jgi:hypothetical protein